HGVGALAEEPAFKALDLLACANSTARVVQRASCFCTKALCTSLEAGCVDQRQSIEGGAARAHGALETHLVLDEQDPASRSLWNVHLELNRRLRERALVQTKQGG